MRVSPSLRTSPKLFRWVGAGGFACTLLLSLAGGAVSVWLMKNLTIGGEARRLADHVRAEIREYLIPEDLRPPLPPDTAWSLEEIFRKSSLSVAENLRGLCIWSPEGKLLWSSDPHPARTTPPQDLFRAALTKGAAFRPHPANTFLSSFLPSPASLSLETWVTVAGPEGKPPLRPSFVVEVRSDPAYLPGEIASSGIRIWLISGAIGLAGLTFILSSLLLLGRMHGAVSRQAAQAALTSKIAQSLSTDLDPDRLFRIIAQEIRRAVPCDRIGIAGVDPLSMDRLYWHTESDLPLPIPSPEESREMGEWYVKHAYFPMRPVNIPDLEKMDPRWFRRLREAGFKSIFILPILQETGEGHCLAHLGLSWARKGGIGLKEENLLVALAAHLGSAIRNAALFHKAETRASRLATLNALSQKITQNIGLQETLDGIVQAAVELLGADIARAFLLREETGELIPQAHGGRLPPPVLPPGALRVGRGVMGRVVESGTPLIHPDVQQLPEWQLQDWSRENGLHSYIVHPLRLNEKSIGAIYCLSSKVGFFSQEDLELLGSFSFQAATAIERARLFTEIRQRAMRLELAGEITKALASTLQPDELFRTIVREIRRAVPCERCVIGSLDRETRQFHTWHYESDISLPIREGPFDDEGTWWDKEVYEFKRPVNYPDISGIPFRRAEEMTRAGLRSALVMPILQDGECAAHLFLASARTAHFTWDHERLLASLSDQLGMAIRNALLYQASADKTSRLEITGEIAKAVSSSLEPEEIFRIITREIRRAVPCERCVIATVESPTSVSYWHTDSDAEVEPPSLGQADGTRGLILEIVYGRKEPYYLPDLSSERGSQSRSVRAGFRSALFVPVLQGERCIAHISISSTRLHAFSRNQRALLASIAAHVGPAIRNAALYRTAGERASRLSVLNEVNRKISENLELDEVLESIAQAVTTLLRADHARIFMLDPESQDLVLKASHGSIPWPREKRAFLRPGASLSSWVFERGQAALVGDLQADPRWDPMPWEWVPRESLLSAVCHPLTRGGRPIGVILGLAERKEAFSQEDLALLGDLASQASIAIEKAVHFTEAKERALRLSVLNQLNQKIIGTHSLDEILTALLQASAELMKVEHTHIFLFDEASNRLTLRTSYGAIPLREGQTLSIAPGEGVAGRVFSTGEPANVHDVEKEPNFLTVNWARSWGIRSFLSHPLTQRGRSIGVINCLSSKAGFFTEEDVNLLGALASQAAIAIEKTTLLTQAQERAARLELTGEIAKALNSSLEPDQIFRIIVREIRSVVPCERCVIASVDPVTKAYHYFHTETDLDVPDRPPHADRISGEWFYREVYQPGRPKLVPNLAECLDEDVTPWAERLVRAGLRSLLVIPILQDGRCAAHLSLTSVRERAFSPEQIHLLTSIAQHVGSAVRNASLYRMAEQRASRLMVLNLLNQQITENLALDETLGNIVRAAHDLLNGHYARLFLIDETTNRLLMRAAHGDVSVPRGMDFSFALGEGITGRVAQTGEPIILKDLQTEPRWIAAEWARQNGLHSFIAQPLRQRGKIIGVINCISRQRSAFSPSDLELLEALASQAAIAVQNARLHDEEKRSREFLNSVVGDTSDPIIITSLDRTMLLWNAGAEDLYGYTESEALGRKVDIILPEDDAEGQRAIVARVIAQGVPATYETRRRRKDGGLIPVTITLSPVHDERGEVVAIAGIHKDLSELKRTAREMQQAKEAAESANRAKSAFLSNLNHELRSPLNVVTGLSDILRLQAKEPETTQTAHKIREAGEHMLHLIEDLLDLDRIAAGKLRLELRDVGIDTLVRSALDARLPHPPEGFSLEADLGAGDAPVRCDPTRAHQILINLLDNAIKYSPQGGTIRVRTERRPGEIWISVRDEGIGVSPEEAGLIFERFTQLGSGDVHRGGGLGIGLHLVQQLLGLQGGRIWVEGEKGKGSTFTFSLPESPQAAPPAGEENGGESRPPAEAEEPWEGTSILVVEGQTQPHGYLKMLLRSAGRVLSARTEEEGIETARKERPDLILLDLEAPQAEGLRLLGRLKSLPETQGIPTVAVSSEPPGGERERSRTLGTDGFICKPIDPVAFRVEIARVLSRRRERKMFTRTLPA